MGENHLTFDMVAVVSIAGMFIILIISTIRNTARLYREERP